MTRVIVCRVGRRPVVEYLPDGLEHMQRLVGGVVDRVGLDDGCDVWFNDEGLLLGLPLNRRFPVVVQAPPPGFELITIGDVELPEPGSVGEYRIHGDLFIARERHGELADVTDRDIAVYSELFASEDFAAAYLMDQLREVLRAR